MVAPTFMRNNVVHYRLIRKGARFELRQIRRPPRKGVLFCEQKCRKCGTTIRIWHSKRFSAVLTSSNRGCCNGKIFVVITVKQNSEQDNKTMGRQDDKTNDNRTIVGLKMAQGGNDDGSDHLCR
jgi:hypothetical protein